MKLDEIKIGMRVWVPDCYPTKYRAGKVISIEKLLTESPSTLCKRWLRYVELRIRYGNKWYDTSRWARDLRKEKP